MSGLLIYNSIYNHLSNFFGKGLNYLDKLDLKLNSLVIFRNLLNDKVIKLLKELLAKLDNENTKEAIREKINIYSEFVLSLFWNNENLTDYIWDKITTDENVYVIKYGRNDAITENMKACLLNELVILNELASVSPKKVIQRIGYNGFLPVWNVRKADFVKDFMEYLEKIKTHGYGIFTKHKMFTVRNGEIVPVRNPDPISLSDLKGYKYERKKVIDNTIALINGKPAANVLLYGDAGTGKSSTVKAIANEYANMGLRLIEVSKNQILEIPEIIEKLYMNPLKFILFIDDLSFAQFNENIGVLKAILEGTVLNKASNIVIYVTSNRRHLVKETFSDRGNDDVHINETIEEQVSLSERFGLVVNFSRPNRKEYLKIAEELAKLNGISDIDDFEIKAERFAQLRGGRSPRIARQFVDYLKSYK